MFNLTQQERQVILFLISVALLGMVTNFLAKRYSPLGTIACLTEDIGKINLNTADPAALMGVRGIGAKLAQRIIEYRKQQGDFRSVEELKQIKGINGYRYEKIKDNLLVK